jgi:hypothetical protein
VITSSPSALLFVAFFSFISIPPFSNWAVPKLPLGRTTSLRDGSLPFFADQEIIQAVEERDHFSLFLIHPLSILPFESLHPLKPDSASPSSWIDRFSPPFPELSKSELSHFFYMEIAYFGVDQ